MDQQTLLAIIAAAGIILVGFILLGGDSSNSKKRLQEVSGKRDTEKKGAFDFMKSEDNNQRRKQIEESLGDIEARQKDKAKRNKSLKARLIQADWSTTPQMFMMVSAVLALVAGAVPFLLGANLLLTGGIAIAVGFGLPRFFLNFAINRRQKKFVAHFADAMDIIVRGVRTGLPLGDCLKIIAHESPEPLRTEFMRVVEGEQVGVPIEVCLERMGERMPISEVSFFATVLNIQRTSGGNLGESLANLSAVLRGRKLLREKIKALSAEAKMSAMIIGALPLVVMVLVSITSPDYMNELYTTPTGHRNLMVGAGMMVTGILVMRKMINFKI